MGPQIPNFDIVSLGHTKSKESCPEHRDVMYPLANELKRLQSKPWRTRHTVKKTLAQKKRCRKGIASFVYIQEAQNMNRHRKNMKRP